MLSELRIRNLAVVEDVSLSFVDGLNVLTGSTGAGKSLILSAVNILLGERSSARVIRAGEDRAVVEGVFRLGRPPASLLALGTGAGASDVTLRREVHRNGRSHAFVNARPCTLKQLQAVARDLIEPHGQNEQLQLKYADNHVAYVDKLADNGRLLTAYQEALEVYREASRRVADFESKLLVLKEKKELLEHRIGEIGRAALKAGEKGELEESIRVLENAQEIFDALGQAVDMTYEDEAAAASQVSQAARRLDRIRGLDGRLEAFAAQLEAAEIQLKETAGEMRAYLEGLEFDPERLEQMQERLAYLVGLERRYQVPLESLVEEHAKWKAELESLEFEDEERDKRTAARDAALAAVRKAALALTRSRVEAAATLDERMTRELEELMMRGARFRTVIGRDAGPGGELLLDGETVRLLPDGIDRVVFHVRTNPGEAEGSVTDVASSGELSRIALALKRVVSTGREGSVLVFDELDAGVGADLGEMIAGKLEAIAERYQIVCITHMPQIAARGRRHLVVEKRNVKGRTFAHVGTVDGTGRVEEIARMLGGKAGSEKRLALAKELLQLRKRKTPPTVRP